MPWAQLLELDEFAKDPQWGKIAKALDRYSAGEISPLVALGLVGKGFLALDGKRQKLIKPANR